MEDFKLSVWDVDLSSDFFLWRGGGGGGGVGAHQSEMLL